MALFFLAVLSQFSWSVFTQVSDVLRRCVAPVVGHRSAALHPRPRQIRRVQRTTLRLPSSGKSVRVSRRRPGRRSFAPAPLFSRGRLCWCRRQFGCGLSGHLFHVHNVWQLFLSTVLCTLLQSIYEGTLLCATALSFYMETADCALSKRHN